MMSEACQTRRMYGHDYAVPGTYEVTIVVAGRLRCWSLQGWCQPRLVENGCHL